MKYFTPTPSKSKLLFLYVEENLTIKEIAFKMNSTISIVTRWFKELKISRRKQHTRQWNKSSFFRALMPEPNSGCWFWIGQSLPKGYGMTTVNQKPILTHRLSYKLFIGEIPKGKLICHHCDTPSCVNPDHLFVGTHADNMKDMSSKGLTKGEKCGHNKLKEQDVLLIRDLYQNGYYSQSEIAKEFNVQQTHISAIVRRIIWKHI